MEIREDTVSISKKQGYSYDIWFSVLNCILREDFKIRLSDDYFEKLLRLYEQGYTINKVVWDVVYDRV